MEAVKTRTECSVGRKKERRKKERKKKMEKSYAQIDNVTKSIFLEPIRISKRGQGLWIREDEIFAYTEFQNCKPISRLVI